jgi:hypothetical protein
MQMQVFNHKGLVGWEKGNIEPTEGSSAQLIKRNRRIKENEEKKEEGFLTNDRRRSDDWVGI